MAIDYVIDYDCIPKQQLTTEGIIERIKGRERAAMVIRLFRENGDERPPSEMGFDFTRSSPDGEEDTELIVVQDILDFADELKALEHHCRGCPANRTDSAFGCMSFVQYPISGKAEAWLLNQLPSINEPLVWLLLKQGVDNFQYDGQQVILLRQQSDSYFEDKQAALRTLGEFSINANQVFEMVFTLGDIIPNHGAMLLLFYNALERSELQANEIMALAPATDEKVEKLPFLHQIMQGDDSSTVDLKEFLQALYIAWALNVNLKIDA
jgi:hypothetical protein